MGERKIGRETGVVQIERETGAGERERERDRMRDWGSREIERQAWEKERQG